MIAPRASWADGDVSATLTASQLLEWGTRRLEEAKAETESAALDARLLVQHVLGCTREALLKADMVVSDSAVTLYDALIARRAKREPVAKIIGKRAFWKQEFLVSAATLDPRPDSETLIEAALRHKPVAEGTVRSLLDLGTGTGCLLLSLLGEYGQAQGLGVDISDQALAVAVENAKALGLADRTEFCASNWCEGVEGQFDLILCNPPYIAEADADALMPEVRKYDPSIALFGGADGLDAYRSLLPQIAQHLTRSGLLLLELGKGQAEEIAALAVSNGLDVVEQCRDLAGIPRVLVCRVAAHA